MVRMVEEPETWTTPSGVVLLAEVGDVLLSDGERKWSIRPQSFRDTYTHVADDIYERVGTVDARPAVVGEVVTTQEGVAVAAAGEWLVTDARGHSWLVPEVVFARSYVPLEEG